MLALLMSKVKVTSFVWCESN